MSLRDYQVEAANCIEEQWLRNRSTLAVLPTGCGKTVLFADIIRRRLPGRSMVVAHREELIFQAKDKIERFAGLACEMEMGEMVASASLFTTMPVVIATVQTLVSGGSRKRMERFDPMTFDTLIIDEFHHAPAKSYRMVLDHFLSNPNLKVLGVTATPDRADSEALGQVCESVAFNYETLQAIEDGWLVPIEQQLVTIGGLDFSSVRTTAGDLNGADLAAIMEAEENLQGLCSSTMEIIGGRQAIVFTASVRHAEMACAIFNRHKPGVAQWVCGETNKEDRRKIMEGVVSGNTQILCNVGVATEGFDAPNVAVIVMGRPTKSRALFTQMAGRGTRPLPGVVDGFATPAERKASIAQSRKPACLIVDFCGNSGKHKLITGLDLLGGRYSEEVKDRAAEILQREDGPKRITGALCEAEEELAAERRRADEERRRLEEARKARLVARAQYTTLKIDPFNAFDIQPIPGGYERNDKTLSEKQRVLLRKLGVDPDAMSYANARQVLDESFRRWNHNLCTLKQAATLKRYGYDTVNLGREDASRLIGELAANRWRPLAEA